MREQFLVRVLDLATLVWLNTQFTRWVEDEYHESVHSGLGMKPVDRFALDLARVKFLSPGQANDELFYSETTRTVKADNTFSFGGARYEAPRDVRSREILVRHDPQDPAAPLVVYLGTDRLGEARPLNPVCNDRSPQNPGFDPGSRAPAQGGVL